MIKLGVNDYTKLNKGVVAALQEKTKMEVILSDYSQAVGAIGAVYIGQSREMAKL